MLVNGTPPGKDGVGRTITLEQRKLAVARLDHTQQTLDGVGLGYGCWHGSYCAEWAAK